MARKGIEWLKGLQSALKLPDEAGLRVTLEKVSRIYQEAYGWPPPTIDLGERSTTRTMRQYIKSWITTWDLLRLYKETPNIEIEPIKIDYSESSDLERPPTVADGDDTDE
jgi:hypothetical protein